AAPAFYTLSLHDALPIWFTLPQSEVVDRVEFVRTMCSGKRVIHAGFWGTEGIREDAVAHGLWLHAQLASVARELVGLDVNTQGRSEEHTSELQSRFDLVC